MASFMFLYPVTHTLIAGRHEKRATDNITVWCGAFFSFAILTQMSSGAAWGFGDNQREQLGFFVPGASNINTPRVVIGDCVSVDGASGYTLFVSRDGKLAGAGRERFGSGIFGILDEPGDYIQVGAGEDGHSLALKKNGELWGSGNNWHGQVGSEDETPRDIMEPAFVDNGFTSISAGSTHSLGLKEDGSLWAWGENGRGEIGTGDYEAVRRPRMIGQGFKYISAGRWNSLAIKHDDSLWGWGANWHGKLGFDTDWNDVLTPTFTGHYFTKVSTSDHTLALTEDGGLWSFGMNWSGQLGLGDRIDRSTPEKVGDGYIDIAAGSMHSLAVKSSDEEFSTWSFGNNGNGQLGLGDQTMRLEPVRIDRLTITR